MTTPAESSPATSTRLLVRHARPEEYDAIGDLTRLAFAAGPYGQVPVTAERERLERDVAARVRSGAVLVAVTADGALVGSATLVRPGEPSARVARVGEAELRLLVVDPERQGSGAGALLVAGSIDEARRWGVHTLVLDTGALNLRAQRLYERTGFTRLSDRPIEPYSSGGDLPHVFAYPLGDSASGDPAPRH